MRRASAGLTTAVALGFLLAGCSAAGGEPDDGTSSVTRSSTATSSGAPATTPPPATPSSTASPAGPPAATASSVGTSTLAPVAVGQDADFGDGLVVRVVGVESEELSAEGPGEVAGPGVLVTAELSNGTSSPIDLDGLTVTASYGEGQLASASTSAPAAPPTGRLEPGDDTTGSWAFAVPTDEQASLEIAVTSISSPNVVTFTR